MGDQGTRSFQLHYRGSINLIITTIFKICYKQDCHKQYFLWTMWNWISRVCPSWCCVAGYCCRRRTESLPCPEGGRWSNCPIPSCSTAPVPADPQHHLRREELHHHLPLAHRFPQPLLARLQTPAAQAGLGLRASTLKELKLKLLERPQP